MLILIDDREIVAVGYAGGFKSEGVCSTGFCPTDFKGWVATVADEPIFIRSGAEYHAAAARAGPP